MSTQVPPAPVTVGTWLVLPVTLTMSSLFVPGDIDAVTADEPLPALPKVRLIAVIADVWTMKFDAVEWAVLATGPASAPGINKWIKAADSWRGGLVWMPAGEVCL